MRLTFESLQVVIDPYLSDRVAHLYGDDLRRLSPPPCHPQDLATAKWILITHEHEDHCDIDTLLPLLAASTTPRLVAPAAVLTLLARHGVPPDRMTLAPDSWTPLDPDTSLLAVPAAHPTVTRDETGQPCSVGYLLRHHRRLIYHAGDTSPHPDVVAAVRAAGPVDIAFLPMNERNYYRERRGIIGNMSVREAFAFAAEVNAKTVVPIHWNLFAPNAVFREEIELLYSLLTPPFRLAFDPTNL